MNCIITTSHFVIRRQILILSVFKIANLCPYEYLLQIKFSMSLCYFTNCLLLRSICGTAVFVNNQHGIQRRGQDFDRKFVFETVHSREVDRRSSKVANFLKIKN